VIKSNLIFPSGLQLLKGNLMKLSSAMFKPRNGTLSAHLFENPSVGVNRDLYWSVYFDFAPFEYDGEEVESNCMVDWLIFPQPERTSQQSISASKTLNPMGEASCYFLGTHLESSLWELSLRRLETAKGWTLEYDLSVDFWTLDEDGSTELNLKGVTDLEFGGFDIVKDSFAPKVTNPENACDLLSKHIPLKEEWNCYDEGFKFVVR
jgi:hypothetical protein